MGIVVYFIEVDGKRILTDPGMFTADSHVLKDIDIVVITHEHGDHLHVDSLKELIQLNPEIVVISNAGVGNMLDEVEVAHIKLDGTDSSEVMDVYFKALDAKHEEIFKEYGQVQNTGYFITERFFYPGDAYAVPDDEVEILALPVAGPWCRTSDVINYVKDVKPKTAFPVHDGLLNEQGLVIVHGIVAGNLLSSGTEFIPMKESDTQEF